MIASSFQERLSAFDLDDAFKLSQDDSLSSSFALPLPVATRDFAVNRMLDEVAG